MRHTISHFANLLICILILTQSCTNPFTTREVEQPNISAKSDIFDPPVNKEVVLSNLRYSLIQKNLSNYMSCFVDPSLAYLIQYRYIPDPSVELAKFSDWNIQYEQIYLNKVFNLSSDISLEFQPGIPGFTNISQSEDSVITNSFRYELRIEFDSGIQTYSGIAIMKLVKNMNANWAIYYWEDTRVINKDEQSWSNLRADYKN